MTLNARLMALELADLGIDVDCVPCLDVHDPSSHQVIGDRAFSADPELVAQLGRAQADGLRRGGILPVIKHIPGHGRTQVDSHLEMPVVASDWNALASRDFRPFAALADLPLAVDKPIDFGLQDFCNKCKKCARECPAQAIPFGDKVLYNGYEIWKPDVEKCTKYRTTNPKGSSCGRCMKMCPFNKEGLMMHRLALWSAIKLPFTRRFLIWLDDALKYGRRNPIKKWWLDLEIVNKRVVVPKNVSERDVHLERPTDLGNSKVATYPWEKLPTADDKETVPVDRKEGLKHTAEAEEMLRKAKEMLRV